MDDCPSCGARLPGAPQWCPRCLTRLDAAQAPVHALVHGGTPAPDLSPSWQANAPPPAPPARRPTASAIDGSDASPPTQPPPSSATTRIRRTVVKAIVLGFVLQLVVLALATGLHMELARAVTFGVVLTLGFYGVVLAMVHARLGDSGLRPVWSIGPPGTALVTGVGVGALQAGVLIVLSSAVAGHLSADSTATTVAAQGRLSLLAGLFVVMVVAAPFVEELLFRGLLAESLRPKGRGTAIWLSAAAFSMWHLRPEALKYYLLCGALLGLLYWKRGLVCSMSAHATFNGLLLVVAVLSVSGPAHAVAGGGLMTIVPASWRVESGSSADLALRSASGARLAVRHTDVSGTPDPASVLKRLRSGDTPSGLTLDAPNAHLAQYRAGPAVVADAADHGHDAELVLLFTPRAVWSFELLTAGNGNARSQLEGMLQKATVSQ